ncbi:hypothetical protein Cyrtocomes_00141 [Candidatus Cyrtobacter comes]|uniref:Uncharacterized protein n=2 Tax=Candidatus Cyrtobacter comes TaxID=675776 RepID=A0ABU5L6N7_9RICK|nr:hypothetical protein [Candidatus Cyrtobacter comes]
MPQNNCVGGAEPTKEELIEDAMRSKLSVDFFYLIGGTDYNFQRHMLNFALYAPNLSGKPDPLEKMKGYFGKIYKGVKGKDGEQI